VRLGIRLEVGRTDPDLVEDFMELGFHGYRTHAPISIPLVQHYLNSVDPNEQEQMRRKQMLFLARHGRQPFLRPDGGPGTIYDDSMDVIELNDWVSSLVELIKDESFETRIANED
jgi:hypothetical protein